MARRWRGGGRGKQRSGAVVAWQWRTRPPPRAPAWRLPPQHPPRLLLPAPLSRRRAPPVRRNARLDPSLLEWGVAPMVLITLCEHLFVSFAVRVLHREATMAIAGVKSEAEKHTGGEGESSSSSSGVLSKRSRLWTVGRFAVSGMVAYIDGRPCRHIPNPIARRIVSGFILSFVDRRDDE